MTGKDTDAKAVASGSSLCVLLLLFCVLLVLSGCEGSLEPETDVDRVGTVPSAKTEAELLAELDGKFENPQAHYELARLYHTSQQWTKAEYEYNVALSFAPANRAAQAGLVKMFVDHAETAKAEQQANSYIRQAAIAVAETLRLAWEFEKLGLDQYALRAFRQALAAAPDSAEVNKQTGFYHLGKGQSEQAKPYLMRSFELNARQPDVAGALGRLGVVVQTPGIPEGTPQEQ
jgi:tetratricopeptide (TPR) repeat protein